MSAPDNKQEAAQPPVTAGSLIARAYVGGTMVTNCMTHYGMNILQRPDDCRLCRADVKNTLSRAIAINEWLNAWKRDAEALLRALA